MVKQQVIEKLMEILQHQVHVNVRMIMKIIMNMEHLWLGLRIQLVKQAMMNLVKLLKMIYMLILFNII